MDPIDSIQRICRVLIQGERDSAAEIARSEIPFVPVKPEGRAYSEQQALRIFRRDGFRDRYSGERLLFPGVLRVLSHALPVELPYHRNWKTTDCHVLYYQLWPTIDHVVPISRGGADDESNWVSTSMLRNAAKGNWSLEELGWTLQPEGRLDSWDGLEDWFMKYVQHDPDVLDSSSVRRWHAAALRR